MQNSNKISPKVADGFTEELVLNVILNNLKPAALEKFKILLESNDQERIEMLLETELPELDSLVEQKVLELLKVN